MTGIQIESLEARIQFSGTIKYGVAANGDPAVTGVLATGGPGLADLGAKGVRLFTDVSFLSSDFDTLPSGKIYVRNPSLATSLSYAKEYHDAGFDVTLCIQLSTDRSMTDGHLLVDSNGKSRTLLPTELRSPKVFGNWYETLTQAQISKTDKTSVTRVLDFWEIGNEVNQGRSIYWPVDPRTPDKGIGEEMNSYVDHELIPAYNVLSKIREPVIGAGLASGTVTLYDELNNQPGSRFHQYSDHVDYLNFHPYGLLNSPVPALSPQGCVDAFTSAMYDDGTVTKPFVITEYNVIDYGHTAALDADPGPTETAEQLAVAKDLDAARTAMLAAPHFQQHCAWIYYYRLIATDSLTHEMYLPPTDSSGAYTPVPALYDLFKHWAKGTTSSAPKTSAGVVNLGSIPVTNAVALQSDGMRLVLSDDGVRRYDASGKLDATYGKNGFVALPFLGRTMALQGDGNLIVAGMQNDSDPRHTPYHLVATRLSTSGKIDNTFGVKGFFTQKAGSGTEAQAVALRAGRIVLAGRSHGTANGEVVRLNLDGSVDTAFGAGGVSIVNGQGPFESVSIAKSGAVTALLSPNRLSPQTFVVRYKNSGAQDKKFGNRGISDSQAVRADGILVSPNGSVLLTGHSPLSGAIVLTRFSAAGRVASTNSISTKGKALRGAPVELSNGSVYLFGSIGSGVTSDSKRAFLGKLDASDRLDGSFGINGILTLSSPNVQDIALSAAISSDNAITIGAATFTQQDQGDMTQELVTKVGPA